MKYTLGEIIDIIDQKLGYPGIGYDDVKPYLNQGMSELNTMLHIGLPSVTEIVNEYRENIITSPNVILLPSPLADMESVEITSVSEPINEITQEQLGTWFDEGTKYFYSEEDNKYGIIKKKTKSGITEYIVTKFDKLIGIYFDPETSTREYALTMTSGTTAYWYNSDLEDIGLLNFTIYLPTDWINLFLIPYVCFGYANKDGGNAGTFQDEFLGGYAQLRKSWYIPQRVYLNAVVEHPAYTSSVKFALKHSDIPLNHIQVDTRAITPDMRYGEGQSSDFTRIPMQEDAQGW